MTHLLPIQSESKSLRNSTHFKGWTEEEIQVLKTALIKYGFGNWQRINKSNCLPGKKPIQMYFQAQKLICQQSLSSFMGLHVNIDQIYLDNKKLKDMGKAKNLKINDGDNLTGERITELLKENKRKYGYPPEYYKALKIPRTLSNCLRPHMTIKQITVDDNNLTLTEKIEELQNLICCMKKKLEIIDTYQLEKKTKRGREKRRCIENYNCNEDNEAGEGDYYCNKEYKEDEVASNNEIKDNELQKKKDHYPDRKIYDEMKQKYLIHKKRNRRKENNVSKDNKANNVNINYNISNDNINNNGNDNINRNDNTQAIEVIKIKKVGNLLELL